MHVASARYRPARRRSSPRRSAARAWTTLQRLADVVLRPVDRARRRCASTTARSSRRASQRSRRRHPHRRVRLRERARARPAAASRSARAGATPTTSTSPPRPQAGIPVLRAPGRNADAVAEITVALLFAVNRGVVPADRDVRDGRGRTRDGTIPYQRYRAWQLAGRTAGHRRARRRRPGRRSGASRASGMRVHRVRPVQPRRHAHSLDELLAECDVVSMHAVVTPETDGHDRRRAVRAR